jgi:signal transduction histidine kinase
LVETAYFDYTLVQHWMTITLTPDPTSELLSRKIAESQNDLAARWLKRLEALLPVDRTEVFPSHTLLDHIPQLIVEIAEYLRSPETQEIAANTGVMQKAAELGILRYEQRASVHQLLREYQVLGDVLDEFIEQEVRLADPLIEPLWVLRASQRVNQAVRVLQQQTVDTFVLKYTSTIERQTLHLRDFSRLVSHEIRQPLGVLQVVAKLLRPPQGEADAARLVDTLERNVTRLGDVAGKLERLARISRARDDSPTEQRVDLAALVRDVALQLADMADARDVQLRVNGTLPVLIVDPARMELVFLNLLANAIKYSDPEKPQRLVDVSALSHDTELTVVVRDNGIGIPAGRLNGVFEEFVRAHTERDEELGAQGLGLGLAIVRECMEAMAGRVSLESVEGQGTVFTLTWPVSGSDNVRSTAAGAGLLPSREASADHRSLGEGG